MERFLIEYCAETLAGLKSANLFSYPYESTLTLQKEIETIVGVLQLKGIGIRCLKLGKKRALIYVYREFLLQERLKERPTRQFLLNLGYGLTTLADDLQYLSERLITCSDFPHEIGLFLDYPLEDVMGFIKYKGQDYKAKGYWKVYDHEYSTLERFETFTQCRSLYLEAYLNGIGFEELICR